MRSNLSIDDPDLFKKRIAEKEQQRMDQYELMQVDSDASKRYVQHFRDLPPPRMIRRAFKKKVSNENKGDE
jgi:hypothetical protein